ncbi:hypothetical protein [Halorhodospira halochloris]|uniref:hypothetical protein n=1 Tax=Halorhodospira halochloris TaxID=1052 RepID=UPI000D6F95F5|nr:hypothetical protein [Halorhodospira halochloris]MBK1651353.1 hypothetical protein [Halorhodospira halochloris]
MDPSLEASWRHPWRQDLHTGADGGTGEVLEVPSRGLGLSWDCLGSSRRAILAEIARAIAKNHKKICLLGCSEVDQTAKYSGLGESALSMPYIVAIRVN